MASAVVAATRNNSVAWLFALASPWLLGAVADRWGLPLALALLALQPVGLAVMAVTVPTEDSRPPPADVE